MTAKLAILYIGLYYWHLGAYVRQRIAEEVAALQADSLLAADIYSIQFP